MIEHGMTKRTTVTRVENSGLVVLAGLALLLAQTNAAAQGGSVQGDRAALEALYHATDGPNWSSRAGYNWLTDEPLDRWGGVSTEKREGRVDGLELDYAGLAGSIPPEFGDLTKLQRLSLASNNVDLPAEIRNLAELRFLKISRNEYNGPIPTELLMHPLIFLYF